MTDARPYKNVLRAARLGGPDRWMARLPDAKRPVHLGTFDSPVAARRAVLEAQARKHEEKAARLRAEAAALPEEA